jgi:hypothetical protein
MDHSTGCNYFAGLSLGERGVYGIGDDKRLDDDANYRLFVSSLNRWANKIDGNVALKNLERTFPPLPDKYLNNSQWAN